MAISAHSPGGVLRGLPRLRGLISIQSGSVGAINLTLLTMPSLRLLNFFSHASFCASPGANVKPCIQSCIWSKYVGVGGASFCQLPSARRPLPSKSPCCSTILVSPSSFLRIKLDQCLCRNVISLKSFIMRPAWKSIPFRCNILFQ